MLSFTDQTGRTIALARVPRRIVSLVPSQSELLFELGLNDEVVGITKFCVHPQQWFHSKTRVGGTKQLNGDVIHSLEPELIIANKEENAKEQVEELAQRYPVWISNVNNPGDAFDMITQVGAMTGKERNALSIIARIKSNFSRLTPLNLPAGTHGSRPRATYLIWQEPYMTVGGDTFIHSMMECAGFENIYLKRTRYPEVTLAELESNNTELLFLSSEPFPFKQKHIDELRLLLPGTKILLIDGEMFSWYGSRMQYAPAYFLKLREKIVDAGIKMRTEESSL